ncbi:MAG: RNA polymerase sigma factor [Ruminococcaceae bacterium]|nr:RNA polymerase sigma factor [Oscillospiraceae bacterium]
MADRTIDSLLRAIADGQTNALSELYERTDKAVYAFALSILKNAQDAEDVMHDCYVNIFRSASCYHSDGKPMAWILTITRNLCMNLLRTRKRTVELTEAAWLRAEPTGEDRLILSMCMQELSDTERQIVVLHAIAGFKHREIAQFLSMTLSGVLSKYHRAIQKMKRSVQ